MRVTESHTRRLGYGSPFSIEHPYIFDWRGRGDHWPSSFQLKAFGAKWR